jgi:hypothetical protein
MKKEARLRSVREGMILILRVTKNKLVLRVKLKYILMKVSSNMISNSI